MPTTPFALVLASKNGGAASAGAITGAQGDTIQLSAQSTVGWKQQRYEIYSYPPGFGAPAGWSTDSDGSITGIAGTYYYSGGVTPPTFTLSTWGKWLWRLSVNENTTGDTKGGLTDDTGGANVSSPSGLSDIAPLEDGRFGGYDKANQANLRTVETAIQGGGAGFTLDASSADLASGDAVMPVAGSSNPLLITRATPALLRSAGATILGLVDAPYTHGASGVVVRKRGEKIPASAFPDLGAGTAVDCQMNASGRAVRKTIWQGGEIRMGRVDTSGEFVVDPYVPVVTAPPHAYSLEYFGAVGDGIHDDTAAWEAFQAAIPSTPGTPARLILGHALYYMAGGSDKKIHNRRSIHLIGSGGGNAAVPVSGFVFPPLGGLLNDGGSVSIDGGSAQFSTLEHFDVKKLTAIAMTGSNGINYYGLGCGQNIRVAGTYVEKGTWVLYSGATAAAGGAGASNTDPAQGPFVAFEAVTGFTPAGAEPAGFASAVLAQVDPANGSHVITDGAGSWSVVSLPKDYQFGHNYSTVGECVVIPGDTRFMLRVKQTGTSGNSANFLANFYFKQPPVVGAGGAGTLGEFFDTNGGSTGLKWEVVIVANIFNMATDTVVRRSNHFGGIGPGVLLWSGYADAAATKYVYSDYCDVDNARVLQTGLAVALHGENANGCTTAKIRYDAQAVYQRTDAGTNMGTGEMTIWDMSQEGGRHYDSYAQGARAPAFVNGAAGVSWSALHTLGNDGNGAKFFGCNSENVFIANTLGNWVTNPGLFVGTSTTGNVATNRAMEIKTIGCVNVQHISYTGGTGITCAPLRDHGSTAQAAFECTSGSNSNGPGYYYGSVGGISIPTGSWARCIGPTSSRLARAMYHEYDRGGRNTAAGAAPRNPIADGPGPGVGIFGIHEGYCSGRSNASGTYHGVDAIMRTSETMRYGARIVGDTFPNPNATYQVGTWRRINCITAGYDAQVWTAGTSYFTELDVDGQEREATQVVPSGSPTVADGTARVFRFVSGSANNGVEPAWNLALTAGQTFTDAAGRVWQYVGLTCVYEYIDFVDDPNTSYSPQAESVWGGGGAAQTTGCIVRSKRTALTTTNATANQIIGTYVVPTNSAEVVDYVVVAKDPGGNGSAGFKVPVGAERGATTLVGGALQYNPGATLLWATGTLATLTAASVTAAASATTGGVDIRATGIAAQTIHWGSARQGVEAA